LTQGKAVMPASRTFFAPGVGEKALTQPVDNLMHAVNLAG